MDTHTTAPTPTDTTTHLAPTRLADLPALLLRAEVAALARCTTRTVERAQARGVLASRRPYGARALYARGDVLRWLGVAGEVGA